MYRYFRVAALVAGLVLLVPARARGQVPSVLSYQGVVQVSGTNFDGAGQFRFALVSANASQTYWLNSPDVNNDGVPDTAITLAVHKGLFSVFLGDTNVPGMAVLPPAVFTNQDVNLRTWFNDGTNGLQQLAPDQRLGAVGYAMMAGNIADGAITLAKLAPNTATQVTAAVTAQADALAAQLGALAAQVNALSNQYSASIVSGLTVASTDPQDAALRAKGFQLFNSLAAPGWVSSLASGAPSARSGQAGVWTSQELLVWGGNLGLAGDSSSGGRYRPDLDEWQPVSTVIAPAARSQHTAVWSGQEMVVWGGISSGSFLNTGGRFNPTNQLWTALSTNSAPAGRAGHVAVWTGNRMVVWGGRNSLGLLNDGALYDPALDQWTTLTLPGAPIARSDATGVWTGNRLVIWGGQNEQGALNTGGQLIFDATGSANVWTAISGSNAPAARFGHAALWTGQKMLIWGGQGSGTLLADGAAYDPVADTWSALATNGAPTARSASSVVWTGQELLVFGGQTGSEAVADGAAYNPLTDSWRPLSGSGNPLARSAATAVWSGSELLVFGGVANAQPLAALQRLNPQPAWYLYRKP